MGMGCCARGQAEYLVVLQKTLERVKWVDRSAQQTRCLEREDAARWPPGGPACRRDQRRDIVIDLAAGSFSVMEACRRTGRRFLGCDING